jgi:multiple sugar transport system substrate-binding protein
LNILRIALRNYKDFENALEEEARLFEEAHPGTQVELSSVGSHELYALALTDGGLREGRYDLALLVTDWLAEGMASGALEDLHVWQKRAPIPDWPEGWAESLVRPLLLGDRLSSLPWHDGPECLVYRTDVFDDCDLRALHRTRFGRDLVPPTTWQEFEETARFLTSATDRLYGTVFAAFPDGHNTVYDFALQVWSRGGELRGPDGLPCVDSPEAVHTLDFYRRVVCDSSLCHPQSPQLDSTQCGEVFLTGEVAMMVNWFGFAARSDREGSPLEGKVAIAPIPSDPGVDPISLSVFWAMAMGAGSKQKELAWEFLRFLSTPERDLGITKHGTVGVRLSTWRDPELQARVPAYGSIERISLGARQLPTGPQMADFAKVIDEMVTLALTTEASTVAILKEAQHKIESEGIRWA